MAKLTKYNAAEVISSVRGCKGIKKIVCLKLGISRPTFDRYLRRWRTVKEAFEAEKEGFLDEAEFVVVDAVVAKRCLKTSKWVLGTMGGHRGYVRSSQSLPCHSEDERIVEVRWVDHGPSLPVEDGGDPSLENVLLELNVRPADVGMDREEK